MELAKEKSLDEVTLEGVRFVFLDRDGVINYKAPDGDYIKSPDKLTLLPGAAQAVRLLNNSFRKVIVATNQRGIALGQLSETDLLSIHEKLQTSLQQAGAHLDAIYYCPHDLDSCDCRKPRAGMLRRAFRDFPDALPENSVMIGDSESDMAAGKSIGMRTIRIVQDRTAIDRGRSCDASTTADSLLDAVEQHLL
jgi:D-glycero-D-manno-heptose 1,7-bisphosphate phosphatase